MEPNTQDTLNNQPMSSMSPSLEGHKKTGPIVAIVIVTLVIIAGLIYMFAAGGDSEVTSPTNDTAMAPVTNDVRPVTNTSDDISSIETDLNASVSGLDEQNF